MRYKPILKYFTALYVLTILFVSSQTTHAQTPLLQALIDATPAGGTLELPCDVVYPGPVFIRQSITIQSPKCRAVDVRGRAVLVGAQIVTTDSQSAITILPNTDNVTLDGLDIYATDTVGTIVMLGDEREAQDTLDEVPNGFTLIGSLIHGSPVHDSQRGLAANGANVSVIRSSIYEIHGRGYDTQAICMWNGPGPLLIQESYLEASGENVMIGGAWPSIPGLVPTGIAIQRSHFFKPLSWYVNHPSYAGFHWTVKNLFELKNARSVVVEGCIFENNWTDAQAGRAIALTPRPSDSGSWAFIEDVEFRNNIVRNVGSGMIILGADEAPAPTENRLRNVRVVNNLFTVDGPSLGSNGTCFTVINKTDNVTIDRNTCVGTNHIILTDYAPNTGFVFTNNIARHNEYGIFGSGIGIGNPAIDFYFPGALVTNNAIVKEVNAPWNVEFIYPAGNLFPETLNLAIDGNFRSLISGVGADIDVLNAAMGGTVSTPTPSPTPEPTTTPTPEPSPSPSPRCRKFHPKFGTCLKWG